MIVRAVGASRREGPCSCFSFRAATHLASNRRLQHPLHHAAAPATMVVAVTTAVAATTAVTAMRRHPLRRLLLCFGATCLDTQEIKITMVRQREVPACRNHNAQGSTRSIILHLRPAAHPAKTELTRSSRGSFLGCQPLPDSARLR